MSDYNISKIYASDKHSNEQINALLESEGIRRDTNLDYTCGIYDDNMNIIATGSCFKNTLRCMAVSSSHQGEGLMNEIVSHLTDVQYNRGNPHLFLYTKCNSSKFFGDLGFYEIVRIDNELVFMENRKTGFKDYLKRLENKKMDGDSVASIVMNANPFTLGHQFLVEKAAAENDIVHLFIVSEDSSLIPFHIRKRLIQQGTAHLKNVFLHESGPYIISNATFPSYFQQDEESVIRGHALLDLTVFQQIADVLGIHTRYVGEEPNSLVTGIYNQIMSRELPKHQIDCRIIPRKVVNNQIISASAVRKAIHDSDWRTLETLVPETTYQYFISSEAENLITKIQKSSDIIHY